jgi:hypothetical protein
MVSGMAKVPIAIEESVSVDSAIEAQSDKVATSPREALDSRDRRRVAELAVRTEALACQRHAAELASRAAVPTSAAPAEAAAA